MTYRRVCDMSSTTGVTCGARTAYHSGASEFTSSSYWSSCCLIVSFLCFVDDCLSFWPFCFLSLFDLRLLINPLLSSNFPSDFFL